MVLDGLQRKSLLAVYPQDLGKKVFEVVANLDVIGEIENGWVLGVEKLVGLVSVQLAAISSSRTHAVLDRT